MVCQNCPKDASHCGGHYWTGLELWRQIQQNPTLEVLPFFSLPSAVLETEFTKEIKDGSEPLAEKVTTIGRRLLLDSGRVTSFIKHMQTVRMHRVSGAAKAAETRRKKLAEPDKEARVTAGENACPPKKRQRRAVAANKQPDSDTGTNHDATDVSDSEELGEQFQDTLCSVCLSPVALSMLLCDACDSGLHMACASPKICREPKDLWFCGSCACDAAALPSREAVIQQFLRASPQFNSFSVDDVVTSMRPLREAMLTLGQLDEAVTLSTRGLPALGLPSRDHIITLLANAIQRQRGHKK
jgi:hypothetical protein